MFNHLLVHVAGDDLSPRAMRTSVELAHVLPSALSLPEEHEDVVAVLRRPIERPGFAVLRQHHLEGLARIRALDASLQHRSPYKPEINYDMTKNPPEPIMDSTIETKGHDWLPGWLRKWWPEDPEHPPFEPGRGMVKRPDVIIVKDPTKPPTQDNIKKVVEIKFPPDKVSEEQKDAYEVIAGDAEVVTMTPDKCDCDKMEPDKPKIPVDVEDIGTIGTLLGLLSMLLGGKGPRRPMPAPAY
ncbi:VRR-NUC domain-containing protein [Schlegelella sp. S2-27]|uniref:VRR-NUC domain-containing protein n=1 Tax=Caldimonas mangrovi TaxID=2944811 RepID=A0ABT0YP91_9BURK|nr:VRR-NUC domain-containing protein [Caldimonas mangrovi]MCM5680545.1 VRR-NUC domain-containing protein [Caldimonas mangrovi]